MDIGISKRYLEMFNGCQTLSIVVHIQSGYLAKQLIYDMKSNACTLIGAVARSLFACAIDNHQRFVETATIRQLHEE